MKHGNLIVLAILLVATAGVLSLRPQQVQGLKTAFLQVISPFLKTGSALKNQVTQVTTGLKTLDQLEKEYDQLQIENKNLRAINQTLRNLEEDNNRLRRALAYREQSILQLVPARVVTRSPGSWWNTVTINRGSDKGLKPDMPVVTDLGLVGKVTTVAASMSEVVLISDERLQVAADIEGSRERGIIQGSRVSNALMPLLNLNFLSKDARLRPGQKVYCSGLGGVFPSGILVGTVHSSERRALDTQALVVPAVDLSSLSDVFVITGG